MSYTLQNAFESGQDARIVQIDFSATFDTVDHQVIFYRLCCVGIEGSVLWWMVVRVNYLMCQ